MYLSVHAVGSAIGGAVRMAIGVAVCRAICRRCAVARGLAAGAGSIGRVRHVGRGVDVEETMRLEREAHVLHLQCHKRTDHLSELRFKACLWRA